jgi:hypothetical protein
MVPHAKLPKDSGERPQKSRKGKRMNFETSMKEIFGHTDISCLVNSWEHEVDEESEYLERILNWGLPTPKECASQTNT